MKSSNNLTLNVETNRVPKVKILKKQKIEVRKLKIKDTYMFYLVLKKIILIVGYWWPMYIIWKTLKYNTSISDFGKTLFQLIILSSLDLYNSVSTWNFSITIITLSIKKSMNQSELKTFDLITASTWSIDQLIINWGG